MGRYFLLVCLMCTSAFAETDAERTARMESEKAQREKLVQVVKEYQDTDPKKRMAALLPLENSTIHEVNAKLSLIVQTDPDTTVQDKAFEVLCTCEDKDGTKAGAAVALCASLKRPDQKLGLLNGLERLKFRYAAVNYMVNTMMQSILYPAEPVRSSFQDSASYESAVLNVKQCREGFARFVKALNALAGTNFVANEGSKYEVKTWWQKSGPKDVSDMDKKLADDLRAKK